MATGKRYYWLKLKESFLNSPLIDYIMTLDEGKDYFIIYQFICMAAINTDGRLAATYGDVTIPYDIKKITRDCRWFSEETVENAIKLFKKVGLITTEEGIMQLDSFEDMVGSETDFAAKKRRQRQGGDIVPTDIEIDIDKEKDIDIDIDIEIDKEIDIEKDEEKEKEKEIFYINNNNAGEAEASLAIDEAEASKDNNIYDLFSIPLKDSTLFTITRADLYNYTIKYPHTDVNSILDYLKPLLTVSARNGAGADKLSSFITRWLEEAEVKATKALREETPSPHVPRSPPPPEEG